MSLKKQTDYIILFPAAQPKSVLLGNPQTVKTFTVKEATGEQLQGLIQGPDAHKLEGAVIYEIKRSFVIKPVTQMTIEERVQEEEKPEEGKDGDSKTV